MATDLSQDAVLGFLRSHGGSVKNSDLLLHFRNFIRNHADRDRNREMFKRFVNTVATVRQEDGVSYVVLRKKFRGHIQGDRGGGGSMSPENHLSPAEVRAEKPQIQAQLREVTVPAPPGETAMKTILPAAGIINNNNMETNLNLKRKQQQQQPQQTRQPPQQQPPQQQQQPQQQPQQQQPPQQQPQQPQQQQTRQQQPQQPQQQPRQQQPLQQHQQQPQQQQQQPGQQQPRQQLHQQHSPPQPRQELQHQQPQQQQQPPQQQHLQTQPPQHRQQQVNFSPEPRVSPAVAAPLHFSKEPCLKNPGDSEPPARLQCTEVRQQTLGFGPPPGITPVVRHYEETRQQGAAPQPLRGREACGQPGGGLHQDPPLHPQVTARRFRHRPSYKSAVSHDDDEDEEEDATMRRGTAGGVWPLSAPLEGSMRALSASSPCIIESPAPPSVASSSPSGRNLPKIFLQDVEGGMLPPISPAFSFEPGVELKGQCRAGVEHTHVSPESTPIRFSQRDLCTPSPDGVRKVSPHHCVHQDRRSPQPSGIQLEPRSHHSQGAQLSSSHSSIFSPSSDAGFSSSDWPPSGSSRGSRWNSSYEDLQAPAGETGRGNIIADVLQRAQRTKLEPVTHLDDRKTTAGRSSPFHHSTEHHDNQDSKLRMLPWHLSTGDLYDDHEDAESSDGSSLSSPVRQRPAVTRRLSSQVRSRMCRSLGADLDQLLQEEVKGGGGSEAARLNRLYLISSSLSLHHNLSSSSLSSCSTPPRSHSVADLVERERRGGGRRSLPAVNPDSPSTAQHEGSGKQSLVPLEPNEHTWLVKGAAGEWPEIYSLFRDEPSLLNKRDFISGFTVLHWISKHGDHRVLNTLWYGVQKAGLMFDINARSTSGHTPLHVAAIHGNKNIMRLLVSKFDADVKLRDTAGKRPWQYLSCNAPLEIFQLLGAPARVALGGDGPGRKVDSSWEQQQQQHRRRRHHFSTASSGERPLTIAGTIRVKRSSSIAALLKHKSLRRLHARKSDFLF